MGVTRSRRILRVVNQKNFQLIMDLFGYISAVCVATTCSASIGSCSITWS